MATQVLKGPMVHTASSTVKRKPVAHDLIRNQLNTLLENEILYKKQIQQMEKESHEMTKAYEAVYDENKVLRSLVEHGPDTARIAQLNDEIGKMKRENHKLVSENKTLKSKVKGLEKQLSRQDEDELDTEWNAVLAEAKRRREKLEEAMKKARTARPAKQDGVVKSSILRSLEEEEEINIRIDTLEKEVYILQNNIKRMKMEWENISFSRAKDKGNTMKNEVIANAINDKLTRDIYRFELRLNKLRSKQAALKNDQEEFLKKEIVEIPEEVTKVDTSIGTAIADTADNSRPDEASEVKPVKTNKTGSKITSGRGKLPQLKIKPSSRKSGEVPLAAPTQQNGDNDAIPDEKPTAANDTHVEPTTEISGKDKSAKQLAIHTRQEAAEMKAIARRQKWEELQAKKILPVRLSEDAKKQRGEILARRRHRRAKNDDALYKTALNRSLDDISQDQTRSPIPIEFKEMGNFMEHDEVKLILKRWDRPVYERVEPWHN